MESKTRKIVGTWLVIGLVMVIVQVILGGVTRLTDSGLSITEWNVIKGTIPPLNETDWNISFEKYKNMARQQFEMLHADMTLKDFKRIYFWEWSHRLWARSMGFVFLFPFLYFLKKKMLPYWLIKRLGIVILLAALAASFGWIMVASGLENEQRTWVSAYKLSAHLGIAALLFYYLFNSCLLVLQEKTFDYKHKKLKTFSNLIIPIVFIQILLGGLMAGMRAGVIHMYWPFFMGDNNLVSIITSNVDFSFASIINYESNVFIKAVVQVFHRSFAWFIVGLSIYFAFKVKNSKVSKKLTKATIFAIIIIFVQFTLGIFTILNYSNPDALLVLGILHQSFAFISLLSWLYVFHQFRGEKVRNI